MLDDLFDSALGAVPVGDGMGFKRFLRIMAMFIVPFIVGLVVGAYLSYSTGPLAVIAGVLLVVVGWLWRRKWALISFGLGLIPLGSYGVVLYLR